MENEEKENKESWLKENWTRLLSLGITIGLGIVAYQAIKENKSLRTENARLKGSNENYKDQVKGYSKTVEKLSFFLGKKSH